MNHVTPIGPMGSDPEVRTTGGATSVGECRNAVQSPGSSHADWLTIAHRDAE